MTRKKRAERFADRFHSYAPNALAIEQWSARDMLAIYRRAAIRCRDGWRAAREELRVSEEMARARSEYMATLVGDARAERDRLRKALAELVVAVTDPCAIDAEVDVALARARAALEVVKG